MQHRELQVLHLHTDLVAEQRLGMQLSLKEKLATKCVRLWKLRRRNVKGDKWMDGLKNFDKDTLSDYDKDAQKTFFAHIAMFNVPSLFCLSLGSFFLSFKWT